MQPKNLNLNQLVADHLKSSPRVFNEKVRVDFMSDEDLGNVYADPAHLKQLLTALFQNANSAMPDGGELTLLTRNIKKEVSSSQSPAMSESENYIMLSVADTGSGLDNSAIDRIFEASSAAEAREKNIAPDLFEAHNIVGQYKGGIKIRSEVGEGTTFQIYFPTAE